MLVLFVCPNPALDRAALVPGARHGGTVRASTVVHEAGGKALHAARVAAALGAEVRVVAPLGGETGARVAALMAQDRIELVAVPISGQTRQTYTVVDDVEADVVEVIEPSPVLTPQEAAQFEDAVVEGSRGAGLAVCAGSLPAGVEPAFMSRLVAAAHAAGARCLVDAAGAALEEALKAGPDLVKPNLGEAQALIGADAADDARAAGVALCSRGARAALVTDGSAGAVLTEATGADFAASRAWRFTAPRRRVVNAVGCGDAVLGGTAAGLALGLPLVDAVVQGMAAAADKVGRLQSGLIDPILARAAAVDVAVAELHSDRTLH